MASPWAIYSAAKLEIGDGRIVLSATSFEMRLFTELSNCDDDTLTLLDQVSDEVEAINGYQPYPLHTVLFIDPVRLSADPPAAMWTAQGGPITGARFAVINTTPGRRLLCRSILSPAAGLVEQDHVLSVNASPILRLTS